MRKLWYYQPILLNTIRGVMGRNNFLIFTSLKWAVRDCPFFVVKAKIEAKTVNLCLNFPLFF